MISNIMSPPCQGIQIIWHNLFHVQSTVPCGRRIVPQVDQSHSRSFRVSRYWMYLDQTDPTKVHDYFLRGIKNSYEVSHILSRLFPNKEGHKG